ncbi:MAG: hypothetical protein QOH42_1988 [Blastocatellia bacterium]|nr:hypothetical protein [Blastocatellia bacterium]
MLVENSFRDFSRNFQFTSTARGNVTAVRTSPAIVGSKESKGAYDERPRLKKRP